MGVALDRLQTAGAQQQPASVADAIEALEERFNYLEMHGHVTPEDLTVLGALSAVALAAERQFTDKTGNEREAIRDALRRVREAK